MNAIVNKLWLTGGNFMAEMHLKQPGYIYSVFGPCTKKKRVKKN